MLCAVQQARLAGVKMRKVQRRQILWRRIRTLRGRSQQNHLGQTKRSKEKGEGSERKRSGEGGARSEKIEAQ